MPPSVRVKSMLHSTHKNTPTDDVPELLPELLTHEPPTYLLPTFLDPCKTPKNNLGNLHTCARQTVADTQAKREGGHKCTATALTPGKSETSMLLFGMSNNAHHKHAPSLAIAWHNLQHASGSAHACLTSRCPSNNIAQQAIGTRITAAL